jgi:putative tryptophan/tyrosine transport system substrate-binding protein
LKKKITVLTLGAVLVVASFSAEAQLSRTVQIGYLGNNESRSSLSAEGKDFLEELRRRGWVEGQNIVVEQRYWENRVDRLAAQAAELVSLKVDIIVTSTGSAARAVKEVTAIIPIVMVGSADAVTQGLAISLARPGGNITGLTAITPRVTGRQFELMKEAFPGVSLVAVLRCGSTTGLRFPGLGKKQLREAQDAARSQKIHLLPLLVRGPGEIGGALELVMRERADALFISDCVTVPPGELIEFAAKSRLPAIFPLSHFVKKGGLMSYGADQKDSFRRAAHLVDKILKGANPSDLPVEQPTKFELVINLKTARQIGVTIPPAVLMWADEVIK